MKTAIILLTSVILASRVSAADFNFNPAEVSPVDMTEAQLVALLNGAGPTPYLDAYQQKTIGPTGQTLNAATLKAIPTGLSMMPYLGVFQAPQPGNPTKFTTYATWSADLMAWRTLGPVHVDGGQPDIRLLNDGSLLYADEYNPNGRPVVYLAYYGPQPVETGLLGFIGTPGEIPTNAVVLPRTVGASADGTPEYGRISYGGNWETAKLQVNYHFYAHGIRDLDASGTLTDGAEWSGGPDGGTNALINGAGGLGKIGHAEEFQVSKTVYKLVEAQLALNDNSSWRLFLVNRTDRLVTMLQPALAGGAVSIGVPTLTFLRLPDDTPALCVTMFVFGQGHGTTPTGGHMRVDPLPMP
jgi:hypothetical protein